MEQRRLWRVACTGGLPGPSSEPLERQLHHFSHRAARRPWRPEVDRLGCSGRVGEELFRQEQVAQQRLDDELPGANRIRVAQPEWGFGGHRPPRVGQQAIGGDVASADHVAGTRNGHRGGRAVGERTQAAGGNVGARLGGAVRVVSTERVGLGERPASAVVGVDLVARHDTTARAPAVTAAEITLTVPATLVSKVPMGSR